MPNAKKAPAKAKVGRKPLDPSEARQAATFRFRPKVIAALKEAAEKSGADKTEVIEELILAANPEHVRMRNAEIAIIRRALARLEQI